MLDARATLQYTYVHISVKRRRVGGVDVPRGLANMSDNAPQNLRRLMAGQGLSVDQLAQRTGLDRRTIRGLLHGRNKPHPRTLKILAEGLGVSADEFFIDAARLVHRCFDEHTNPVVDEVIGSHPALFAGWMEADFADLHSRVGTGGPLTEERGVGGRRGNQSPAGVVGEDVFDLGDRTGPGRQDVLRRSVAEARPHTALMPLGRHGEGGGRLTQPRVSYAGMLTTQQVLLNG